MPMKTDSREYRNMTMTALEVRADEIENEEEQTEEERMIVQGYASTFNEPYTLFEDDDVIFQEVVDRDAFTNTDMSDVIMQYNHEGRVFARISNNTLSVEPDDKGLFISADLSGTEIGRNLFQEIRGGYTDKMSFGFTIDGEDWIQTEAEDGRDIVTRRITSVKKLFDVSAVSIPANDATSISVRNLTEGVISQIREENTKKAELELARRRTEVRAKALSKGE